jgi:hypothetical protein
MDELRELAERIAEMEDEAVADFAGVIARLYRYERLVVMGMIACQEDEVREDHPMLTACTNRLRGRMLTLLAWAEQTGRR